MKKLISFTLSVIILISLVSVASFADTEPPADTVKYISNLQNNIPAAFPAQKVQLAWIARGAGNTDENFTNGTAVNFTNATNNGTFSYQFENDDGTLRGRVTGDNGTVRIFALRTDINTRNNLPVHTYAEVRKVGNDYFRGATGTASSLPGEIAVYDFAMQFVQHFATISEAGHDHGNHTTHKPGTIRESAERFPFTRPASDFAAGGANHVATGDNVLNSIVFTYNRDDLGGFMSAMILTEDDGCGDPGCADYKFTVKHVSHLQNSLPAAFPAQKVQLGWIARGAGNTEANFAANGTSSANWANSAGTNRFSYEFNSEDGTLKGRVTGDDGEVKIFALRTDINPRNNLPVHTYAEVRKVGNDYFRGATGTTAAAAGEIAVYDFAIQYVQHFATISEAGHDHGNHTAHRPDTIRESAERFPLTRPASDFAAGGANHVATGDNALNSIVFTYSRDDLGGMMSAMIFNETVKHVRNLQNVIPAAFPAQKVQLGWIARGAGNTEANFAANGEASANWANSAGTNRFSYEFSSEDGTLKGRVTGDDGEVKIFALRTDINTRNNLPVHTYAEVRKVGNDYFRGATGTTAASAGEIAVYDFAYQYTQHFDSITEYRHSHYNPTGFKPATIRESAETFPISRDYVAPNGAANPPVAGDPKHNITFVYSRDDLGGLMSAMVIPHGFNPSAPDTPTPPVRRPGGGGGGGGGGTATTAPATTTTVGTGTWAVTNIPRTALTALALGADIPVRQLRVPAGATGNTSVSIGAAFAGQNAVLVRYNAEANELEFVSAATIGANGNANVNIAQAGDFLVLTFKSGDITGTGAIETSDALALLRHIAGISELNSIQLFVANGKTDDVNTIDALNILRVVAGIIPNVETAPAVAPPTLVDAHDLPAFDRGTGGSGSSNGGSWCDDCGAYH